MVNFFLFYIFHNKEKITLQFYLYLGHEKQPKVPLVRLRIFHPHTFVPFSVRRFGHSYVSKVANIKDIILFTRKKTQRLKASGIDNEMLSTIMKREGFDQKRVEDLVKKYFEQVDESSRLLVLSENGVSLSVKEYVDKEVREAIDALVNLQMEKTEKYLKEKIKKADTINEELVKFREERKQDAQEEAEFQVIMKNTHTSRRTANDSDDDISEDETVEMPAPVKGRGRGRGRGSRGARGSSRGNSSTSRDTSYSSTSSRRTASRSSNNDEMNGTKRTRNTSRSASKQTDLSSFFQNKDEDIIDESDEEAQSKRRKVAAKSNSTRRQAVIFEDFSD